MKKNYIQSATTVVSVAAHGHILNDASPLTSVGGNTNMRYGGAGTNDTSGQGARVKGNTVDWDNDWSK
ncbi:MAG: hypothetical protein J6W75_12185 [Bacteroidaceae bacterium]|nr:hypothetical protein [Prevotella sp.]MBP5772086.1 hypothetical protein [Bacteroidaceae bacterium]